jgi:hypothetical protein
MGVQQRPPTDATRKGESSMTETKQLTKDRNYYRMLTNAELIAHIKGITNPTELERVLAERLKEKIA